MKRQHLFRLWIASAGLLLMTPLLWADGGENGASKIGYELIGQVLNLSPQQSLQYGYLNNVAGLDRISINPGLISESTALLTFFNDTKTERVINNGPIRVIDRTGTGAIYFDESGSGNFNIPDFFRDGKAVQTYDLRHQVVIDTSTGYFTATFELTVTSTRIFQIDNKTHRLGSRGAVYRLHVFGKLNPQAPPSAYIAGVADGGGAALIERDDD